MRSMQQQLGVLGTISAFAVRHREIKKNLCRGGRSQDLPDTDFYPAIRQLKCAGQQYTHSKTIHMRKQRYTHDNNTIHKRPTTVSSNAHRKSNTMGKKVLYLVSNIVTPQVLHTNFNRTFTSLHFTTPKCPSRYTPIYPPSLHYPSLHFTSLRYTFS